jgi:hypothetical protein
MEATVLKNLKITKFTTSNPFIAATAHRMDF